MNSKLIHEGDGQRTFAAVLDIGDEVMGCLGDLAREQSLSAGQITGIGAFSDAVVAYFDWESKKYLEIPVGEQVEVASLNGDIGIDDEGKPALHIHLVLGRRDGSAVAGHLIRAHVRPTLEVIVTESPAHLRRYRDPGSRLNLIRL
jgi:predicted DNA-binding protein with PD1-like motif